MISFPSCKEEPQTLVCNLCQVNTNFHSIFKTLNHLSSFNFFFFDVSSKASSLVLNYNIRKEEQCNSSVNVAFLSLLCMLRLFLSFIIALFIQALCN